MALYKHGNVASLLVHLSMVAWNSGLPVNIMTSLVTELDLCINDVDADAERLGKLPC